MAKKISSDTTGDNAKKAGEPAEVVTYWLNEIAAARRREKDFRKEGRRVIDIYEGKKKSETPFNILFSNTETMLPALYSNTPRAVVQRRFKDDDPLGRHAAMAGQRILEFLIDTNIEGYETVDEGMKSVTLDALLPGRGTLNVKYDYEEGTLPAPEGTTAPEGTATAEYAEGEQEKEKENDKEEEKGTPYKKSELVCINTRSWNRVYYGYARKWSKVPWVAYEEHIDREEAIRLFGKEIADKMVFTKDEATDNEEDRTDSDSDERNTGELKTCCVYQIWKKDGRKVCYISAQYHEGYLKENDDPLGLTGFFDCPRPLQFVEKVNDLLPVALYELYENQASELNRITTRINRVVEAVKARGVYDAELGDDLKNVMKGDDNELVPAEKASSLSAEKGLQNAIWFMPLDVLVGVLEKLYVAREQCKQVIYEIMGIADILRGSSKASETLGAQKIKTEWGTLRLKPKQKEVQRYARDVLRLMLEIASTKFSEETWAKMTGLPFLLEPKFNELTQVAAMLKAKVAADAAKAQAQAQIQAMQAQPQQPAQPPPPPPPSPEAQQLQQVLQQLQTPRWSSVLSLLRDDTQRAFRIDIETNSTVEPEAVEDQKNIAEVMTALGQYLNSVTPLIVNGSMPFEAAKAMMLAIVRRFRFGNEIEDEVKAMQPPKPQDDGKEQQAAQQMMQAKEQQLQKDFKAAQDKLAADAAIAKLEKELATVKAEKMLIEKSAALDIRELKVKVAEDILKLNEKRATESITNRESVSSAKNSADQKVRSVQEQGAKREQQVAKAAESGVVELHGTIKNLVQMQAELLQTVQQQIDGNKEVVLQIVKAVTAPRRSTAIRGKDGKLSETVSEIVN